jgi:hypothetical protein
VSPAVAGIALIPATVPIILAGPLAGRVFDRRGGRFPLVLGFAVLAASGLALTLAVPERSVLALVPGLLLQGIGLGVVLTVNDPTGLGAVPERDRGVAAGMINTSEQLGGALGIAALSAAELTYYRDIVFDKLASQGIRPTEEQILRYKQFVLHVEQTGLRAAPTSKFNSLVINDLVTAHVDAFQLTFILSGGLALLGAAACLVMVRKADRYAIGRVFGRRSRWVYMGDGREP